MYKVISYCPDSELEEANRKTLEKKILTIDEKLNELAQEGWEIVSLQYIPSREQGLYFASYTILTKK